jgi:hypothetical protein
MNVILRTRSMKDAVVIVTTLGVFALIVYLYLLLKPTVILPPPSLISKCPTRWTYDPDTGDCTPQYPTQCKSFNPDAYPDKCGIASACGTTWKGLCP